MIFEMLKKNRIMKGLTMRDVILKYQQNQSTNEGVMIGSISSDKVKIIFVMLFSH